MLRRLYDPFAQLGERSNLLPNSEVPALVTLVSPAAGATVAYAAFAPTWSPAHGARSYDFQKASDSGFTTAIVTTSGILTLTTSPGLSAGTYYWRVRAVNRYGQPGPWSAGRQVILS